MADQAQRTIRFVRAQVGKLSDEQCQALVQIESPTAGLFTGTAQGGSGEADGLRAVARATADAVSEAVGVEGVAVRIRGIQRVEAFGQTAVIVSIVASREGRDQSLLGVCDSADDPARAAALAVLNAANRFLGVG